MPVCFQAIAFDDSTEKKKANDDDDDDRIAVVAHGNPECIEQR